MSDVYAGKVGWITGASSGIGAALARAFSGEGMHMILSGRAEARLAEVAPEWETETLVLPVDVRDEDAMHAATAKAIDWARYFRDPAGPASATGLLPGSVPAPAPATDWRMIVAAGRMTNHSG